MNKVFSNLEAVKSIKKCIDKDKYNIYAYNSVSNNNIMVASYLLEQTNRSVILVCPNIYKAIQTYESAVTLLGISKVNLYCMDDFSTTEVLASSPEYKEERLYTIASIINNDKKLIIANLGAVLRPLQSIKYFKDNFVSVEKGADININEFLSNLIRLGYRRVSKVEALGEFSVRGEVIDIYALGEDFPIRLDLYDTEIETIKYFDVGTQRSINEISKFSLYPIQEIIIDNSIDFINNIKKDIKTKECEEAIEQDILDIEANNIDARIIKYLKYTNKELSTFIDYVDNPIVCYSDIKDILDLELHLNETAYSSINECVSKELDLNIYTSLNDVLFSHNNIYFQEFKGFPKLPLTDLVDFQSIDVRSYHGNIADFFKEVQKREKYYVCLNDDRCYKIFNDALSVNKDISNIEVIKGKALSVTYFNRDHNIHIIGEESLFRRDSSKEKKYHSNGVVEKVDSPDELIEGDYVVHYDYGIAKYFGLKSVTLNGVTNDYLLLQFDKQQLYVPVENIGVIDKYQGSEGHVPKLSKIGSKEWSKKKENIRVKLHDIAKDLIEVQAMRNNAIGAIYNKDTEDQELLESEFEFEETKDQLETINTIKKEMEAGHIIDRLICGDVGYGKTEVALRIAFKTILQGKQVAYLAPTTILSRQHYYTFSSRMEKFGINVRLINRFVNKSETEKIIESVNKGGVDCLIGTHAILSDRIKYKDLGLLIIDEEQRFGVEQKEKIKKLKENVNVLTLTATPIPRTLQMSLVGVRDLSLIQTPPKNRYPVKTYVIEDNDIVIKEAIYNELARKGQVFYLHNKVSDLEIVAKHIKELVPEARIVIGHGQMDRNALEDVIQSFIDKEADVLLCTTIIETGIDIPNTNTLIVDTTDRLGLSQMYQLRGRVGRSDRLSYAYFIYSKKGIATEEQIARLNAIKEFTALGSGYKIALRDLSIRGAGDILGKEQSGFIDDVGIDLYMKLLDEEVNKIKGNITKEGTALSNNIEVNKHVSDSYVSEEDIKIYIHKRINCVGNGISKEELIEELNDRFGKLSDELLLYIEKSLLDYLAKECRIDRIKDNITFIELDFSEDISNKIDTMELFSIAYALTNAFSFEYKSNRIIVKYSKKKEQLECLNNLNIFLDKARRLII